MKLYVIAVAAVLVTTVTIWIVLENQRVNEHLVQHTEEVLLRLASVLTDVVDSETAERGFVITGNDASLRPYKDAQRHLTEDLSALRGLVDDNVAEVSRATTLASSARTELESLARVVAQRLQDPPAATASVVAGMDKRETDSIRDQVGEMRRAELILLQERQEAASAADRITVTIIVTMLAILLFGLAFAARSAQLSAARRRVDDFREQFLGTVGHDLRAPLTAIGIEAQMLRRDQNAAGERILSSAQRMTTMVDQLLDVTRSRLGNGIQITRREVELRGIVEAVALEHSRAHPQRIDVEPGSAITGFVDPARIAQVVSNLIGNGIAHGEGTINVRLTERVRTAYLRVHNHGTAIAASELPHIFEPFRARGESEGLGLGLFIADEIVRGHGGSIVVTSTPELGTSFEVALPLDRHDA